MSKTTNKLTPNACDCGAGDRQPRLEALLPLLLDRIDPVVEPGLRHVPRPPSLLERYVGEAAERQLSLDPAAAIAEPPEQGPAGLDEQIEPVRVENLEGLGCRLKRSNLDHGKHGATAPEAFVAP